MDELLSIAREGLYLTILLSLPVVAVSLVIGLAVSVFQAMTQLQDHTLSFVPKLLAVLLTLAVLAPWMGAQLVRFTSLILASIAGTSSA